MYDILFFGDYKHANIVNILLESGYHFGNFKSLAELKTNML